MSSPVTNNVGATLSGSTLFVEQNYSNPFNPTTVIRYHLPAGQAGVSGVSRADLRVYDLLGREVAVLVSGVQPAGFHSVTFDATGLTSGVYLYRFQAGEFAETKKFILMK